MASLRAAAVQMDVTPGPLEARLSRATRLVDAAAAAGAQLVVLPELFNTGYEYSDANYGAAEPPDGRTSTWMRETAARFGIHLAGSLLLADRGDVFDTVLLYAPNGERWRCDKRYPAGWERAYFRPGHGFAVARTQVGAIGLMVCWDVAHRAPWRDYAGKVDILVTVSCTPLMSKATYIVPDGRRFTLDDLGRAASMRDTEVRTFRDTVDEQAAWMGVPLVHSGMSGTLRSAVPTGTATFVPFAPWLLRYRTVRFECPMMNTCRIVDASGRTAASAHADGDIIAVSDIALPDRTPAPTGPQPPVRVPLLARFVFDRLIPMVCVPHYRRALSRLVRR